MRKLTALCFAAALISGCQSPLVGTNLRAPPAPSPQPLTVISDAEIARALQGAAVTESRSQASRADRQKKFREAEDARIAAQNQQVRQRFAAVQKAGGWIPALRESMAQARNAGAGWASP